MASKLSAPLSSVLLEKVYATVPTLVTEAVPDATRQGSKAEIQLVELGPTLGTAAVFGPFGKSCCDICSFYYRSP